jgi:SAM-dependent methyltransferase
VNRGPEYVTDVAYVRGFEKNLSPTRLQLCAALNGFRAPLGDEFDYCELGCAQADTLVALASSFSRARFLGVDLNPAHVATARTLALGGGVENVRFVEQDFEELVAGAHAPASFDFIVAHGVLSWVGPAKRKAVLDFMSRHLKPGGLAYVSYNTLPGWASVEPLRQLILARASVAPGDSAERAGAGVEFACALEEAGAYYFEANPAAKAMLATIKSMSLPYVVHEYLHAHWIPMYFAQVAAEMAERELYFVGQLPAYLNYRDLAIPVSQQALFRAVGDRLAFEGLKDFALNTYFRSDVFVRGRAGRDESATRDYLDARPFGAFGDARSSREALLPNHTLRFNGPVFDDVLPALAEGAASVAALTARPELAQFDRARVRDAILHLILGDRLEPMRGPTKAAKIGRLTVPSAYNRWILNRGFAADVPVILASERMGNGVSLSMVDAAAMHCALEPDATKQKEWIRVFCAESLTHLIVGDRRVEDKAELEAIVTDAVERFRRTRLLEMIELGILASD